MRCRALRFGAVSLRCVLSFENRAVSTGYNACCVRSTTFPLFSSTCHIVFDLSRPPVFSPTQITPILPIRHRQQKHTAQLSTTGQFALHKQLLALSNRCSHQIMGLFFLPPLHMFLVAFFLALRERGGRRQPPAERSPCTKYKLSANYVVADYCRETDKTNLN